MSEENTTLQDPAAAAAWLNDNLYFPHLVKRVKEAGIPVTNESEAQLVFEMAGKLRARYEGEQQKQASEASSQLLKAAAAIGCGTSGNANEEQAVWRKQAAESLATGHPDTARVVLSLLASQQGEQVA